MQVVLDVLAARSGTASECTTLHRPKSTYLRNVLMCLRFWLLGRVVHAGAESAAGRENGRGLIRLAPTRCSARLVDECGVFV